MSSVNIPLPFDAYDGTDAYVFVSYAHSDADIVFPEMSLLNAEGYRLWYEELVYQTSFVNFMRQKLSNGNS